MVAAPPLRATRTDAGDAATVASLATGASSGPFETSILGGIFLMIYVKALGRTGVMHVYSGKGEGKKREINTIQVMDCPESNHGNFSGGGTGRHRACKGQNESLRVSR